MIMYHLAYEFQLPRLMMAFGYISVNITNANLAEAIYVLVKSVPWLTWLTVPYNI